MPKVDRKLLNLSEYARYRGCSRQAVARALRDGRITAATPEGAIDPVVADAQWRAHSRPRVKAAAPQSAPDIADAGGRISYDEARRRQAVADALRAEDELAAKRGELLRGEEVGALLGRYVSEAREIALGVPPRLAAQVVAETDPGRVAQMLDAELRRMLDALAGIGHALQSRAVEEG